MNEPGAWSEHIYWSDRPFVQFCPLFSLDLCQAPIVTNHCPMGVWGECIRAGALFSGCHVVYERKIFEVAPGSAVRKSWGRSLFIREFHILFYGYLTSMALFPQLPI